MAGRTLRAFQNGLSQSHSLSTFESIVQSRFQAKVFVWS